MLSYIKEEQESILHWIMTFHAGFLGTYGILLHSGNFGNAMTGNFTSMAADLVSGHFPHVLLRLGALLLFSSAAMISYLLSRFTSLPIKRLAVLGDALCILLVVSLPETLPPILSVYPIYFCSSFQWGAFSSAQGYNCASVFISNNVKQATLAWTQYWIDRESKLKRKAVLYTFTVLSFFFGALTGSFAALRIGVNGAFIGFAPLSISALLLWFFESNEHDEITVSDI